MNGLENNHKEQDSCWEKPIVRIMVIVFAIIILAFLIGYWWDELLFIDFRLGEAYGDAYKYLKRFSQMVAIAVLAFLIKFYWNKYF